MNKKFFILFCLIVFSSLINGIKSEEYVVNEDTTIISGWQSYCTVSTSWVENLTVGDVVNVTVVSKDTTASWPQLNIQSKAPSSSRANSYGIVVLENAAIYNESTFPVTVSYTITAEDTAAIHENNSLYLSGNGVTITRFAITHNSNTVTTTQLLYADPVVCSDDWSGYLKLSQSQLANAEVGDEIRVRVTAKSTTDGVYPLVDFRNGSWTSITSYTYVSDLTLPADVSLKLTENMIKMINGDSANVSSGLIICGCGVTFDSVRLCKIDALVETAGRGSARTNLWTGQETISWLSGSNNSVKIDGSLFANANSGMLLRMTFDNLEMNGTGKILHNWTSFSNYSNAKLTTGCTNYFEYELTDSVIMLLQQDGLRISGVGYDLRSVDLIDPDKQYQINASYDASDIKAWGEGEIPNITLYLTSLQDSDITVNVDVMLATDTWEDYKSIAKTVTLSPGKEQTVDVDMEGLDPGFYRMAVNVDSNMVCTYTIGYNPTSIVSPDDASSDFWTFWDEWKSQLETIDINAELTELTDYSSGNRKVYEVKMMSVPDSVGGEPIAIYGYYAEPVSEGTHPAIIRFQGTDSGSGTPVPMNGDDLPDWCELVLSTRGQMLSRVKAKANGTFIDYYGTEGFYAYNYGDRDKHYYRAAYLDCVRGIDFLMSRDAVDADHVFATGGSQGGCFTYVAAGLDGRLRAIAPAITGHADFPDAKRIVTWPTNIFEEKKTELGWTDEQIDEFNAYFDTKNFASRITCPVITNFSLQDHTDAPHLNIAPYNLLVNVADSDKTYYINSFKGHATADDWSGRYMDFFNRYIDIDSIQVTIAVDSTGYTTAYYGTKALTVPEGITAMTYAISTDGLIITKTYETGSVIPAATAVVLHGLANADYVFEVSSEEGEKPTSTNLYGYDKAIITNVSGATKYYMLGADDNGENIGFYWGADNGAAFVSGPHKAFLAVDESNAECYVLNNVTNGMSRLSLEVNSNNKIYNLSGMPISQDNLPKGIYIKNGKKVIVND